MAKKTKPKDKSLPEAETPVKTKPKETKASAKKELKCSSCGIRLDIEQNWVEFDCPACGKEKIRRCWKCKKMVNTYKCKCSFEGP